ncbi:MAG: acyltransferase [Bacteroidales bacterium]|nr:acyltransferase [Bacteroidales bacterium]
MIKKWIFGFLIKNRVILLHLAFGRFRIRLLRIMGMKIGKNCIIHSKGFSTEPYLIEIGDHVAIADGSVFLTHDGSVWVIREKYPDIDVPGAIKIGDNSFIGTGALILPGTVIGSNCVIGAGAVVRGAIPDNSVVMGNPAKVVFKVNLMETMLTRHKNKLMTKNMGEYQKMQAITAHFNKTSNDN